MFCVTLFFHKVKRVLKAKLIGVSKVRAIKLDKISVDTIFFDQAVLEIYYFNHDVGASRNHNFYWQH